ncbi:methyltransferase domain-containing protein [Xylanibacillus composti]|uniref:SAM-dependent methyltransferase n=1 Tax=Xylanibacillus composti TaxID=1572762 RepID=A0A8J4H782_9BACL|nr:class I SAM-dependent methyltransferase [Xylanibacillus composti]MDT9724626.1 methyltransferase domain-containing protein [Xylanibacillus composti]GIQ70239.1 SAM-dependent methyltransferase [Xylanibacillus composti]
MGFWSVLTYAHKLAERRVAAGETVIDATAGAGADTLALARMVGAKGKVYSFDIQQEALDRTRERLAQAGIAEHAVQLLLASHDEMRHLLPASCHGRVGAVLFNLGYLPGGNPDVITLPDSTIRALDQAFALLRPGGLLCVTVYPGHPGGEKEAAAVDDWFAQVDPEAGQSICYRMLNRRSAPYVLAVEKKQSPSK